MPIAVQCSSCEKALRVKDALAGKKIKCPACGGSLNVPRGTLAKPPSTATTAMLEVRCVDCERCLPFPAADRGKLLVCPSCGAKNVAEVGEPAADQTYLADAKPEKKAKRAEKGNAAETLLCPVCKRMERNDAVECRRCGYDFETEEREPREANRVWDFAMPLWARASIAAALTAIPLSLIFVAPDPKMVLIVTAVWALVAVLALGTFTRLRLTVAGKRDEPVLIRQRYVAFVPLPGKKYRLWEYDSYDLRYTGVKGSSKSEGGSSGSAFFAIFLVIVMIALCSVGFIPGLIFWYLLASSLKQGEGSLGNSPRWGSYVLLLFGENAAEKRVVIYEGLSMARMKDIQAELTDAAGIRKYTR